MTLYSDLGLAEDATDADIKRAHRVHARKTHPDNGGSMEDFARGQHAYEVLIDPRRRKHYDDTGADDAANPEAMEQAEIFETVGQAIMQFVSGDTDLEHNNVLAMAAQIVRNAMEDAQKSKVKIEAGIVRIRKASKRFVIRVKDSPDVITTILEGRERDLLRQVDRHDYIIRIKFEALKLLDAYSYELETAPAVGGLDYNAVLELVRNTSSVKRP